MDKNISKTLLYETYKDMLTSKMQNIFEQYYYSDLSYREIGENNDISYQAVRDALKKIDKKLIDLESKLKLLKIKNEITSVNKMLEDPNMDLKKIKTKLNKLGDI